MNKILFTLLLFFIGYNGYAQDIIKNILCDNLSIRQQADSLKKIFEKDNFTLLKEASMSMESQYEIPVIVPLKGGAWYRVIFIGDMTSRIYEVRMYDWNEREVMFKKKMWGDVDGNIINYDYIPGVTGYHMIKPVQVNKKKRNVCGYIMLFKKNPPVAVAGNAVFNPLMR